MEIQASIQSQGGAARAAKLTKDQRKEIASRAAAARWSKELPKATHHGVLTVGDTNIPCFVLDDGRRVISGRSLTAAIGMKGRGQGSACAVSRATSCTPERWGCVQACRAK